MKHLYFSIILLLAVFSCRENDSHTSNGDSNIKLNNTSWKINHYEYKSKNYAVDGCDVNDKISFNSDMSGSYQNSEKGADNNCYFATDLAGSWNLDSTGSNLKLNYNNQVKTFVLDGITNDQIRIINTKNINGVGVVEVIEVWVKR